VDPHQGERDDACRIQRSGEGLCEGPERTSFIVAKRAACLPTPAHHHTPNNKPYRVPPYCAAHVVKLVVCAMVRHRLGVERFAHRMLMLHLLRKVPAHPLGLAAVRSRLRVPGDSVGASDGRGRWSGTGRHANRILSHLWAPERHRPCSAFICAGWPPGAVARRSEHTADATPFCVA
jgi:hypothetical protein